MHRAQKRLAETLEDSEERRQALFEAFRNLESDYNSICEYEIADEHQRAKRETGLDQLRTGDCRPGSEVYCSWLTKLKQDNDRHQSSSTSLSSNKSLQEPRRMWCTLNEREFTLSLTSSALDEPVLELPLQSIERVESFFATSVDKHLDTTRSFKIILQNGEQLAFSTTSAEERQAWQTAFATLRTNANRFTRFTTLQRATQKAAEHVFASGQSSETASHIIGDDQSYVLKSFNVAPSNMDERNVANPLFHADYGKGIM